MWNKKNENLLPGDWVKIFVSSTFLLFLNVFFILISDLLSVFLYHHGLPRYWGLKNNHNFQTSDDEKIPITYSKSEGKYLLETIKKLCETKNFWKFVTQCY